MEFLVSVVSSNATKAALSLFKSKLLTLLGEGWKDLFISFVVYVQAGADAYNVKASTSTELAQAATIRPLLAAHVFKM